jgi:hypothetical protein
MQLSQGNIAQQIQEGTGDNSGEDNLNEEAAAAV